MVIVRESDVVIVREGDVMTTAQTRVVLITL